MGARNSISLMGQYKLNDEKVNLKSWNLSTSKGEKILGTSSHPCLTEACEQERVKVILCLLRLCRHAGDMRERERSQCTRLQILERLFSWFKPMTLSKWHGKMLFSVSLLEVLE